MPQKFIPIRRCIGCGEHFPKASLIRVVRLAGTNNIVVDPSGKLDGRGTYICKNPECLKKAKKRINYALGTIVSDEVFSALQEEILDGTNN